MIDFEKRWNGALERITYSPSSGQNNYASRMALASAFANKTFVYGTVGPNTLNRVENTGNPVARAAMKLANLASDNPQSDLRGRKFNLYDPGARAKQLMKGPPAAQGDSAVQMMGMYYGMENDLFYNRNVNIAEFVHKVMEFDKKGIPFDRGMSGKEAYKLAFRTAQDGWNSDGPEYEIYGQSATKEMSKIVRE